MLSILTVDDEIAFCKMIDRFLANKGYKARSSQSGKAALKSIDREKPDVVLLDLIIPDINGEEILMKIKKDYPDLPVIIITGINDSKKAIELLVQGASDYLTKPVDLSYIEKYLSTWEKITALRALA